MVVNGYEDGYDDLSPKQVSTVKIALNTGKHTVGRNWLLKLQGLQVSLRKRGAAKRIAQCHT